MAATDNLKNDINALENEIDEMLTKLEIIGFYKNNVDPIKKKYEDLKGDFYGKQLEILSASYGLSPDVNFKFNNSELATYYTNINIDILQSLKKLFILASCKQLIINIKSEKTIDPNDIRALLDKFITIPNGFENEEHELKEEIGTLLYDLIKKEAISSRFDIIDILYEYENKGCSVINSVKLLYLKEVNEIFKKEKGHDAINLVKNALNDSFDKDDIIALITAKGYRIEERDVNTQKFSDEVEYKTIPYTDRKLVGDPSNDGTYYYYYYFRKKSRVNLLPRNARDNLRLRGYDLTSLNYLVYKNSKLSKVTFENVDLSYTNAIVLPKVSCKESIRGANLEGVDMRGVDLRGVDITGANLFKTGADITGSKGKCLGVSAYEDDRVVVSKKMISPEEFYRLTGMLPYNEIFPRSDENVFDNAYLFGNRKLRQYDISCVRYTFAYLKHVFEASHNTHLELEPDDKRVDFAGLDFSYTNIDFNPQEFKEALVLNLEGVDLRDKDFSGVEQFFSKCNLKGTGANIPKSINPTVSPYIVSSSKTK